jgi:Cu2+-exporting ATPase
MEYRIRHAIPGRLRLYLPLLYQRSALSDALLAFLEGQSWIKSSRINYGCASLVVEYEVAQSRQLGALMFALRYSTLDDLRAVMAQPAEPSIPEEAAPAKPPTPPKRWPLALPTVSLGLALSVHPVAMAVNLPLLLWNAYPIAKRAWGVWSRERRLNIDFLDTLAIAASIGQGQMMTGAVITWLIRLGDWIRDLTAAGAKRAVSELLEFRDKRAWVLREGTIVGVPASEVVVGDTVVVYHGEMIPADGEIIDGRALIDQKTITGESLPVLRAVGEAAYAATIVHEGQLTIRAIRVGSGTTAGQIAQLVESTPSGDTRIQNHAERFADRLVLPMLGLAVGAAGVTADFNLFLSLIIVDYGTGIRADLGTGVDDTLGARRHSDQERRPYGKARRDRHDRVRQDRHADLWRAGRPQRRLLRQFARARAAAGGGGCRGDAVEASGSGGHPGACARLCADDPRLRGSKISCRARCRELGKRLVRACRQRAVYAPEPDPHGSRGG